MISLLDSRVIVLLEQVPPSVYLAPEQALYLIQKTYPNLEWKQQYLLAAWLYFCRS